MMINEEDEMDDAPEEIAEAGVEQGEGDEGEESFDEGGAAGDSKNKLILIVGGAVLLLVGGGAAAYFTGALNGLLGKSSDCVEEVNEDGEVIKACPDESMEKGKDKADRSRCSIQKCQF